MPLRALAPASAAAPDPRDGIVHGNGQPPDPRRGTRPARRQFGDRTIPVIERVGDPARDTPAGQIHSLVEEIGSPGLDKLDHRV
ncbi:hypothetical protein GCM10022381_23810 [Leifsonia kafniensis]|uniref:Uncharacterized protein n=1 Tax=Leifsonia kafniensis TaxID=475957 RepID=A0ABP7KKM3_9MICO